MVVKNRSKTLREGTPGVKANRRANGVHLEGVLLKPFWSRRSAAVSAAAPSFRLKRPDFRGSIRPSEPLRVGHPRSVPFGQPVLIRCTLGKCRR